MKKPPKAVITVAFMMLATIISKLLGMFRSVLLAYHYGTGMEATAFSAASRIPLAFFDLLFSAAILGCFIPIYNGFGKDKKEADEADQFACAFFNMILLFTGILTIIGILFADALVKMIAPGLDEATHSMAVRLIRIMFPMILFTGTAYTLVGIMQSKGQYLLPAFISSISNAGVILYFLVGNDALGDKGIYGLGIAYLIAWFLQFATLAIPLWRSGFHYRLLLDFKNKALQKALKMAPPIMIGSWLAPIGVMSGTFFASYLANESAVTIFEYANNAYIIIIGTLTYSICNFVFPMLSRMSVDGDNEEFNRTVRIGVSGAFYIVVPVLFAVLVLGGEGISVLYMRGKFTAEDAQMTTMTLRWLIIGMPAFMLIEILSRVFYAKKLVHIPMIAAICGVSVNLIASIGLIQVESLGVGAISLANAFGQITAALTLVFFSIRTLKGLYERSFGFNLLKIGICGVFCFITMEMLYRLIGNVPYENGIVQNIGFAMFIFGAGALVYLLSSKLLRIKWKG